MASMDEVLLSRGGCLESRGPGVTKSQQIERDEARRRVEIDKRYDVSVFKACRDS